MLFRQVSIAILGLAVATEAAIIPEFNGLHATHLARRQNKNGGGGNNGGNNNGGGNGGNGGGANCLDASVIQANSNDVSQMPPYKIKRISCLQSFRMAKIHLSLVNPPQQR